MNNTFKLSALALGSLLLTGCDLDSDTKDPTPIVNTETVAISIGSPDFSSPSTVSIIGTDANHTASTQLNEQNGSNNTLSTYKDSFYILDQTAGTVTKYNTLKPTTAIWQCSVNSASDTGTNSNPQQIIHASDDKAYIIRYGNTDFNSGEAKSGQNIWVINPNIASSAKCGDLKTAEINLSQFDSADKPDMKSAAIVNGKLFVAMQNLTGFTADKTSQVVVIDTATDTIIDVDTNTAGVQAINLIGKNPAKIVYSATAGKLFVSNTGNYNSADAFAGIDSIDPTSYSVTNVVAQTAELGTITDVAIISDTKGYLLAYATWGNNVLYHFNPSATNAQTPANPNSAFKNITMQTIVSKGSELWVGATNEIKILNTVTEQETASIKTFMNPKAIGFSTKIQ